jgi:hypothetical protein
MKLEIFYNKMNMIKYKTLVFLLIITNMSFSQNLFNLENKNQKGYLKYGIEPTLVVGLGYLHSFPFSFANRKVLAVFGEISSPTKMIGLKNYEAKLGGMVPVVKKGFFGITYQLNFSTGHVETKNFTSQKIATGNKVLVGVFKPKWHLSFVTEFEYVMVNHIKNSEYYKKFIYPEAQDGWYRGAGGSFNLGIEYSYTYRDRFDVMFDFKIPRSMNFNSFYGSPAHTNIHFAYRF